MEFVTDRSRILAYQRCPRQRYLGFHADGLGYSRKGLSVPLVVGIQVHRGLEQLLMGVSLSDAVSTSLAEYDQSVRERGFEVKKLEEGQALAELAYKYKEQRSLIEAMIRAFDLRGKQMLLDDYEVVSVEQEITVKLDDGVTFMSRPDGILRNRETGQLFVLSFKTAALYSQDTYEQGRFDMQGKSEIWAAQQLYPDDFFGGVQMFYLLKGKYENQDGAYRQGSSLIRPYYSAKHERWAWSWNFNHPQTGTRSTIGNSYKRTPVWDKDFGPYGSGVEGWINLLATGQVQPEAGEDPLEAVFVKPMPYYRNPGEINAWATQVTTQEEIIKRNISILNKILDTERRYDHPAIQPEVANIMNVLFPQHTERCLDFGGCQFIGLCHEGAGLDNFIQRVPHHEMEIKNAQ